MEIQDSPINIENIWFLCTMCWVVFLYPLCSYPISVSAFTLHYCSLKFPKQHFSLSLTSSSPKHSVIWNFLISGTKFLVFLSFCPNPDLRRSIQWKKLEHIPLKLSLSCSLSHLPWTTPLPHCCCRIFRCHL